MISNLSRQERKWNHDPKKGRILWSKFFNFLQHPPCSCRQQKTVWKTEKIPEQWTESTLTQLFKGGKTNDPNNFRYIHDKNYLVKHFATIVVSMMKETLFENMTKFQIAGKPGHRASEHLYVIKSVIAYYKEKKKGLLISTFDLHKFFDSEDIFDCLNELYKSKVHGKLYRLIFAMNKNA